MKTFSESSNNLYFLAARGEMGELIRATDWSKTPLGDPHDWPQCLRTMVAVMLDNPFGMYIAWGNEYIQLYNDAYRPILGTTKHPQALGISTRETFSEIWHIIGPMFDGVMQGKAVGFPDFMLPLNRNGFVEICYFDFSYSPIRKDDGEVGGVLVTVIETTNKKKTEEALKESESRFRAMADNIPNLAWMADADGWIFWYNKKWYEYTGTTPDEMKGWGWQSVHDPRELPDVLLKWKASITSGEPFEMVFPLKGADGRFRQFLTRVLPVHDSEGRINQWFGTNTDITGRIEAEQNLRESEERFRTMAEDTDILIAISDETSNATYFNKPWIEFTGRSMEELVNFGWADLIHPEDREGFIDSYLSAFRKKESWAGEFRMLDKNGEYRWLLAKGPARLRSDGTFAGYISSSIDITERKKAEERLQKSEHKVRSVVESAPFPIAVYVGKDMKIELANQAILDAWGKGNGMIGKSYKEILPELDNQEIFQQIEEVFSTGIPFHARNKRVDISIEGKLQPYYYNYSLIPLLDASGHVYGVMNSAADVTDLNLAKQKVQESESSLRQTILQAPVAMCIFRGSSHIVELANDRMFELWGKPSEVLLNRPIFEGLPEAKDQGFEALLDGVYTTGKPLIAEGVSVTLPRKGSIETVYVNLVYAPYREADGIVSGILVVAVDVTAQVIAHQKIEDAIAERTKELALANSNLQKSNSELAQFAYIASHDLQEPLRKIRTYTQMLENRIAGGIDGQSKSYLSKIDSSSSRMITLIRDVLAYSELVRETEVFTEVDLNQTLQGILADYELLIEQKGASLCYENLPVIEAIPLQMSQLFGNIIGNALKFARKDIQPVLTISTSELTDEEKESSSLDPLQEYLKIQFKDNGIGFNAEYSNKIFNIFQRLHRKSEYEGTGIGLAMCKKIALNHNGDLNALGSSENGAVFNVILPVKQVKFENK